jgi:GC-rich sequence DNA-binding factor
VYFLLTTIHQTPRSLHSFKWYKGLYEYSRPGTGIVEERELGPDGDLVASMISTAVIPMICKLLDNGALDAYSQKGIRRMIDLAEEVEASVQSEGGKFQVRYLHSLFTVIDILTILVQLLLKSVMNCFDKAVLSTETSITNYSAGHQSRAGFDPASIPARRRFLNRRMKLLSNLLRWRKYMGERFGVGILIGRLVERTIMNVAESGWEVGGQDIAHKVSIIVVYRHQSGVHLTPLILSIRLPKCYQRILSHFPYEISESLDECDILAVSFSLRAP